MPDETMDEFTQKQGELDQLVGLDTKQTEARGAQWKRICEQTSAVAQELADLRQDLWLLKKECVNTSGSQNEVKGQHATVLLRIARLEELNRELAGQGGNSIGAVKAETSAYQQDHATVEQRLRFLEGQIGDSAENHMRRNIHVHVTGEDGCKKYHATIEQRVDHMEKFMGYSTDMHTQVMKEVEANHAKIADFHGRIADFKHALDAHNAYMKERLEFIEKRIGGCANQYASEIEALKSHNEKLLSAERSSYQEFFASKEAASQQHRDRIDALLAREKEENIKLHSSMGARIDSLQRTVNVFDDMSRKQRDERQAELRRIWNAIDAHTRNPSSAITKNEGAADSLAVKAFSQVSPNLSFMCTSSRASPTTSPMRSPRVLARPVIPMTVQPPVSNSPVTAKRDIGVPMMTARTGVTSPSMASPFMTPRSGLTSPPLSARATIRCSSAATHVTKPTPVVREMVRTIEKKHFPSHDAGDNSSGQFRS